MPGMKKAYYKFDLQISHARQYHAVRALKTSQKGTGVVDIKFQLNNPTGNSSQSGPKFWPIEKTNCEEKHVTLSGWKLAILEN